MNERDWKVYLTVKQKIWVDVRAVDEDDAWNQAEKIVRFGWPHVVLETVNLDCDGVEEDV